MRTVILVDALVEKYGSINAASRKADVFDQNNDSNVQTLVTLNADQSIGPTAHTRRQPV